MVRYICIFHLKNAGFLHDDFWCLFLNIWMIFAMLVINGSNWFLPGIYSPISELCSCISQDYSLPRKFENTTMTILLTALFVWSFVSLRINIYKRSLEVAVAPLDPSNTQAIKFPKKQLADLTLTIGCVLLLTMAFSIIYVFSSKNTTVDFSVLKFFYVLILPVAFNLFSILFYAKNVKARKTLLRELRDSFHSWIECNQ
jgi:hypothetical protein